MSKYEDMQEVDGCDFVVCINCKFKGLVKLGAEDCQECKEEGCLAWACEHLEDAELEALCKELEIEID